MLAILAGLKPLEERVRARHASREIVVVADRGVLTMAILRDVMGPHAGRDRQFVVEPGEGARDRIVIVASRVPPEAMVAILCAIRALPGVISAD